MLVITLTTDYGNRDYFVSALRGSLLKLKENIKIIDITHEISPFNINEAAYILKNSYKYFPEKSVHIIGISETFKKNIKYKLCKKFNHYFISSDSGIFSLMFPDLEFEELINIDFDSNKSLFPILDLSVDIINKIKDNFDLSKIGKKTNELKILKSFQPTISFNNKILNGQIIYIDRFGNLVSNISFKIFNDFTLNKKFKINLPRKYSITSIKETYSEVNEGEIIALFNSAGFLEISISKADLNKSNGASGLLGIDIMDIIQIEIT